MPLFIVRWPNLSCSLIKANDRDHVLYLMDELGDITGAQISLYEGPVFLDFTLPTDKPYPIKDGVDHAPLTSDDIEIGDISRIAAGEFPVEIPCCDTGGAMLWAIRAAAFPHLHAALEQDFGEPTLAVVTDAIRAEALVAVQASWRETALWTHGSEDEQLAALLGIPVKDVPEYRRRLRDRDE
jgi:hypothetical protein